MNNYLADKETPQDRITAITRRIFSGSKGIAHIEKQLLPAVQEAPHDT